MLFFWFVAGKSGYCECENGRKAALSSCEHPTFKCADECAKPPKKAASGTSTA